MRFMLCIIFYNKLLLYNDLDDYNVESPAIEVFQIDNVYIMMYILLRSSILCILNGTRRKTMTLMVL